MENNKITSVERKQKYELKTSKMALKVAEPQGHLM